MFINQPVIPVGSVVTVKDDGAKFCGIVYESAQTLNYGVAYRILNIESQTCSAWYEPEDVEFLKEGGKEEKELLEKYENGEYEAWVYDGSNDDDIN